jgi:uncharacterized membrane protein
MAENVGYGPPRMIDSAGAATASGLIEKTAAPRATARTASIDLLRGAVMVLMVLDHARDFFNGFRVRPTDLAATTPALFFTRWITHFCAPVFVLLAGVAACLFGMRNGPQRLSRFLLSRGLWLVILEVTVVRLCWIPDPGYHLTVIQVIWTLGWSMIVLAALSRLPWPAVAAIGGIIVAGHNLLDGIRARDLGGLGPLWTILHQQGVLEPAPGHRLFISYPILPWIGVMALGFCLGRIFTWPADQRRRFLIRVGGAASATFVVLRFINIYGDPKPWTVQPRGGLFTLLSFLNCDKYPPSLAFLLMTLGPALIVLGLLQRPGDDPSGEREPPALLRPLLVFGRVPLLFYVGHLVLLRYVSLPLSVAKFGFAAAVQPPPGHAGSPEYPLWATYVVWALALLLLYPLCRWFAAVKARRRDWWLSYL